MNNPFGLEVYTDPFEADEFNETHGCSTCWGLLQKEKDPDKREWISRCENCQENTRGYVTRKYINRRIKNDEDQARIAKQALKPYVKFLQAKKLTEGESLKALGF